MNRKEVILLMRAGFGLAVSIKIRKEAEGGVSSMWFPGRMIDAGRTTQLSERRRPFGGREGYLLDSSSYTRK
jgi:hypothetical protein